jgi:hypothetical protein
MQKPDRSRLDEEIIQRYRDLHDAYHEQCGLIPTGRFHEVTFSELESDPVASVRTIYEALDLPEFDRFQPVLDAHLETLKGYRKNRFEPLELPIRKRLADAFEREFELWDYNPS